MLHFIVLSNLVCLLLPALTSAHVTTPKSPVNIAAQHVKRLSTPLKNLLHKREAILFPGTPGAANALALNSTNGEVTETIPFEENIAIENVHISDLVYFIVKGEIDYDLSVTVEFWDHYLIDRRIGVYYGDLVGGVDMKISDNMKIVVGEARLYVVKSAEYEELAFEAYGSVQIPSGPIKVESKVEFHFAKLIKRWEAGNLQSIQDIPNTSGVQTPSTDAGVDTSYSVE